MPPEAFLLAQERIQKHSLPLAELLPLASSLSEAGHTDLAAHLHLLWLEAHPDSPQAALVHFSLGTFLHRLQRSLESIQSFEKAIQLHPDLFGAYLNLSAVLESVGLPQNSILPLVSALQRLTPLSSENLSVKKSLLTQLARIQTQLDRLPQAEECLESALSLAPHSRSFAEQLLVLRLRQCKWPVLAPLPELDSQALLALMHPLSVAAFTDDPLLQLASASRYVQSAVESKLPPPEARPLPALPPPHSQPPSHPLRVGYLCSDLRAHALGYLLPEVFELHNPARVEVFAYYSGPDSNDPLQQRIRAAVPHWIPIASLSDLEAAERIRADGIEILVDLNGHSSTARTGVFALRPAPVQVNWLGYPGSMGSPFHHYLLADPWVVPPEHEIYYSEKVLHLSCYQPNDRKRPRPEPPISRTQAGLPPSGTVFCCFNSSHKITPASLQRWLEILRHCPQSVLWLLSESPEIDARLRSHAQNAGISPERLVFAPKIPVHEHLARYPLADLFLDSFPYGAHTTGSDALWMGVPVLTLCGLSFASRVCGSLVRAAGLPELACTSETDFLQKAIFLGTHPDALAALKQRLDAGRSTCLLFQLESRVAELESLFDQMRHALHSGALPKPRIEQLETYHQISCRWDHPLASPHPSQTDYHQRYLHALTLHHHFRPLQPDGRLWSPPSPAMPPAP